MVCSLSPFVLFDIPCRQPKITFGSLF
jgi:hypothetical protein